jgi:hypothetical protein
MSAHLSTSRVVVFSLLATCLTLSGPRAPLAEAALVTIISDPSDTEIFGSAGAGMLLGLGTLSDMGVGDTGGDTPNLGRRSVVRFDVRGLSAAGITSAILKLTIVQSRRDQFPAPGIIDGSPPFTNPGLGDTQVIHIADSPEPTAADYGSPSIGNDPGTLVAAGVEAAATVSVDATQAVRQALNAGQGFVAFRVQTAVETDGDGLNDLWFFASGNRQTSALRPRLEVETTDSLAAPRIVVDFNNSGFSTGGTLIVTFDLTPGSPSTPVDVYVVIQVPGGAIFSLQPGGGLIPGAVAFATAVTPVHLAGEIFRHTFAGPEPSGGYGFFVGLTQPGTLTPVSAVEQLQFFYNP